MRQTVQETTMENIRSPLDFNWERGMTSCPAHLRGLALEKGMRRSERYAGANPCRALKTNEIILKSILHFTGDQ